jgi:hypothetical protein
MSQPWHTFEISAVDLFGGRMRHLRCGRPIILAGQEKYRTFLGINLVETVAGVEATKVEVEVAVEDTVCLTGI